MNQPHIAPLVEHPEIHPVEPAHEGFIPLKTHVELTQELDGWRMRFVYSVTLCGFCVFIIVCQACWIVCLLPH